MPGLANRRAGSAPRGFIPSLAIAGVGAAVAMAAAAPAAVATPQHRSSAQHQAHAHAKHVTVKGLVAAHHGRSVAVFAKTAKVGATTSHNKRLDLTFARSVHHSTSVVVGSRIRVDAVGRMSGNHLTIVGHNDETVTPAPASLFFGSIVDINGTLLTVSEHDRDNGDNDAGDDHGHGHDGNDNDNHATPADDGPGGPGNGGGNGGGHGGPGDGNGGPGHQITVDDSTATITVDGSTGSALAVGDTVAVLGESTNDTIVAAEVFGFTTSPAFLRGDITGIDGDNVTLGGDHHGDDGDVADDHGHGGGDNDAMTVSLAGVPLALNGDEGATTSQLVVGDKLIVLGSIDSSTGALTPQLAFAFNDNDDNPCGHNGGGDHHGHDGGSDG